MGMPVAKQGDQVVGVDTHIILIPGPGAPVPTPMPLPFSGPLQDALSGSVFVENKSAAVEGSVATNTPSHIPIGGSFQSPPSNRATVSSGSASVFAEHKALARANDTAKCCNDPTDQDTGHVIAVGTVFAG
jgi:uncharacterized Zn-binding protein involved in type VI secretion